MQSPSERNTSASPEPPARTASRQAWLELGARLEREQQPAQALRVYAEGLSLAPDHGPTQLRAGLLLAQTGQFAQALPLLEAAHRRALRPGGELLEALARAQLHIGRPEAAEAVLQRLLARDPDRPGANCLLAQLMEGWGELPAAMTHYRRALEQAPPPLAAQIQTRLGNLLRLSGEREAARQAYTLAQELQPDQPEAGACLARLAHETPDPVEALLFRAKALERQRDFAGCHALVQPAIAGGIEHPVLAELYATACLRLGRPDEPLAHLERLLEHELGEASRRSLLFLLGDLYDRLGRSAEAFASYRAAHALAPQTYDPARTRAESEALIGCFDAGLLQALRAKGVGHPSRLPVFIVGMPRSGTTLTEQILSSHPAVYGGGELSEIQTLLTGLLGPGMPVAADAMRARLLSLDAGAYTAAANRYLDRLVALGGHRVSRVSDKQPANFRYLGLIRLLFPQAAIVHCRRDPWATSFSCYSQNFREIAYNRDLAHLGAYYRDYRRLMAHWQSLGIETLTLDYEQTVAGLEANSRRLLDHLGLGWDPACLDFHRNRRRVLTASQDQVRRPIYTDALERHLRYAEWLTPLAPYLND